jgi:predicted SAM-dependent methyltransferase
MSRISVAKLLEGKQGDILKLDIGGGTNPEEGFINMDIRDLPEVDVVQDCEATPWPFPDKTFTLLSAAHIVEHINPHKGGFLRFMDECWRVLKYEGQMRISTPYGGSTHYMADPTHINPCVPHTFHYFDPMQMTRLYFQYEAAPWKIEQLYWSPDGNIELLLSKRRDDISYHADKKIHYE